MFTGKRAFSGEIMRPQCLTIYAVRCLYSGNGTSRVGFSRWNDVMSGMQWSLITCFESAVHVLIISAVT